jgi:hypothetical protein
MKTRIAYRAHSRSAPIGIPAAVEAARVPEPELPSAIVARVTPTSGNVAGNIDRG